MCAPCLAPFLSRQPTPPSVRHCHLCESRRRHHGADRELILTPGSDELELYDVEADPRETTNLVDARPEIAGRLHASLRAWMSRPERELDSPISPEHEERLRQLGYIQ